MILITRSPYQVSKSSLVTRIFTEIKISNFICKFSMIHCWILYGLQTEMLKFSRVKTARSPCWPPRRQQVWRQRWIWESIACRWQIMQVRKSTLALTPRADLTRSPKQGYQCPHKKDCCPAKIKKKTIQKVSYLHWFLG